MMPVEMPVQMPVESAEDRIKRRFGFQDSQGTDDSEAMLAKFFQPAAAAATAGAAPPTAIWFQ